MSGKSSRSAIKGRINNSERKIDVITIEDSPPSKSFTKWRCKPSTTVKSDKMQIIDLKTLFEDFDTDDSSQSEDKVNDNKSEDKDPISEPKRSKADESDNQRQSIVRMHKKKVMLDTIASRHCPYGHKNLVKIIKRVEEEIFNKFGKCDEKYGMQMFDRTVCLAGDDYKEMRLNLIMGRLAPERFAFMDKEEMSNKTMEKLRVEYKTLERELFGED